MSTDRTVAVPTWGGGMLVMPEPEWCAGHEDSAEHPGDFVHSGPGVELPVTMPGGDEAVLLRAALDLRPLDTSPMHGPAKPTMLVELGGASKRFDTAGLRRLSDELAAHSDRLLHLADELAALRGESDPDDEEAGR